MKRREMSAFFISTIWGIIGAPCHFGSTLELRGVLLNFNNVKIWNRMVFCARFTNSRPF